MTIIGGKNYAGFCSTSHKYYYHVYLSFIVLRYSIELPITHSCLSVAQASTSLKSTPSFVTKLSAPSCNIHLLKMSIKAKVMLIQC